MHASFRREHPKVAQGVRSRRVGIGSGGGPCLLDHLIRPRLARGHRATHPRLGRGRAARLPSRSPGAHEGRTEDTLPQICRETPVRLEAAASRARSEAIRFRDGPTPGGIPVGALDEWGSTARPLAQAASIGYDSPRPALPCQEARVREVLGSHPQGPSRYTAWSIWPPPRRSHPDIWQTWRCSFGACGSTVPTRLATRASGTPTRTTRTGC